MVYTAQVTHNGLCHTDAHMIDNDWGISGYPFIPGHEVRGIWHVHAQCVRMRVCTYTCPTSRARAGGRRRGGQRQ